jgi:hypothetical protein
MCISEHGDIFLTKYSNVSGTARRKACKIFGSFSINLHVEHNFQQTFLWRKRLIYCKVRTTYEHKTQIISLTVFITRLFHSVYICYCLDFFRPQFLSVFRKLASLSTYTTYVVSYAKKMDFIYQCLNIIRIKIIKSLRSVYVCIQYKINEEHLVQQNMQKWPINT